MKTNQIILQGTTSQALSELINEGVKTQIQELKKSLEPKENHELLTRTETCKLLKIDQSTLWHWTNKGKVTAYGISNRRYYKKEELLSSLIALKKIS